MELFYVTQVIIDECITLSVLKGRIIDNIDTDALALTTRTWPFMDITDACLHLAHEPTGSSKSLVERVV